MAKSIVLTTLSVFMGLFFIFVGSMKITPNINREMHREIRRNFVQYAKVFPSAVLFAFRINPKWLRLAVGWTEVCSGTTLLLIPGHVKQFANVVLLTLCLGAIYTHAMLRDQFERMAPALFFTLLLGCRLVVFYQVRKREQKLAEKLAPMSQSQRHQRQHLKQVDIGSEDQEGANFDAMMNACEENCNLRQQSHIHTCGGETELKEGDDEGREHEADEDELGPGDEDSEGEEEENELDAEEADEGEGSDDDEDEDIDNNDADGKVALEGKAEGDDCLDENGENEVISWSTVGAASLDDGPPDPSRSDGVKPRHGRRLQAAATGVIVATGSPKRRRKRSKKED